MNRKEYTITTFAQHIGTTKQNISQLIEKNKFSFPGYRLDNIYRKTKIIKVDRWFVFFNKVHSVLIIVKEETPELATLTANDVLFGKQITSFRFKLNEAKEIEEKEVLITNFQ